jgi:hypothetical protein
MSATAKGNPDEQERFANHLERFLQNLQQEVSSLAGAYNTVCETWGDAQRHAFEDTFNKLIMQLRVFEQDAGEQIIFIRQLAVKLREYLDTAR